MTIDQVRMEDINNWVGGLIDKIESEVSDYNKLSSLIKEDELFVEVRNALEKFFNYPDYRNYN